MGQQMISSIVGGQRIVSQSFEGTKLGNKIEKIQPLMSIFPTEMLAKANKVNQEVSEKIAKIKAMQQEWRKPEKSRKSSVRSGRQMSDDDYN